MVAKKTSILAVDDEPRLLRMMELILKANDCQVITAKTGEEALAVFDITTPDLVLLDLKLPSMDGYSVCRRIREFSHVPIVVVTAIGDNGNKVKLLEAGADDYITKPFPAEELVARVRAVSRRAQHSTANHQMSGFQSKDMTIDFAKHQVMVGDHEIKLTTVEYRIIAYLAINAGKICTSNDIIEAVWGDDYIGDGHILRVNITRLRNKLGDNGKNPKYIQSRIGLGYMITKD